MFEKASRIKLRFDTQKGQLSVEDLWDIPLTSSTGKVNLDSLAGNLDAELKSGAGTSFVNKTTAVNAVLQLKFDIVLHVINIKVAERDAARQAADNRERKQKIMEAIDRKQDDALNSASIEELQAMVNAL